KEIPPYEYRHLIKHIKLYFIRTSNGISRDEYSPERTYIDGNYLVADFENFYGGFGESYKIFIEIGFINDSRIFIPVSKEFVDIQPIKSDIYRVDILLETKTDDLNNSNYFIDNLRVVK
ncbi:hypothetical protein, partial [Persephonella sp.]